MKPIPTEEIKSYKMIEKLREMNVCGLTTDILPWSWNRERNSVVDGHNNTFWHFDPNYSPLSEAVDQAIACRNVLPKFLALYDACKLLSLAWDTNRDEIYRRLNGNEDQYEFDPKFRYLQFPGVNEALKDLEKE